MKVLRNLGNIKVIWRSMVDIWIHIKLFGDGILDTY